MANIGLDDLYYAPITMDSNDEETYGTPVKLAKAISAGLTVELAEAILYADNAAAETVRGFKSGKLTLGIDDIGTAKASALTGAAIDNNGVLVATAENDAPYVAVGFRAKKSNGLYRYFWLYKVKFSIPGVDLQTQGDSISFQTPTIEGTVLARNKASGTDAHPWKAEVTEGDTSVTTTTTTNWFTAVYEPDFSTQAASPGSTT